VNQGLKRRVAIGAASLVAVAGGGVAYAATTSSNPSDAIVNDAAKRLNVTPDQLRSALQGAFGDQLDQAVKDGKLTQAQADRMKQRIAKGGLPFGGPGGPGPGGPRGLHLRFGGPGDHGPGGPIGLDAAAKYLGLSDSALQQQLGSGKTLADVAKAQGKSLDGLEQALVDEAKTHLDQAVKDGKLTQTEADALVKRLQSHVDDIVNGKGPGPGGPGPRWRGMHHDRFGPPPPPPGPPGSP
jgi:polyhydroxyalkanoate synthesis regulator phasin